jgi:hypothetical protein
MSVENAIRIYSPSGYGYFYADWIYQNNTYGLFEYVNSNEPYIWENTISIRPFDYTCTNHPFNNTGTNFPLSINSLCGYYGFTGYLAEVIIYNKPITPEARHSVEHYIEIKYHDKIW